MILAAGRGERMRPLTDATPKPLLEVGGRPLITWLIEALARAGFRELVINVSHLGARVESALADGRKWNVRIRYSHEEEALETAGGIANARSLLGPEPFVVVNGDVHTDFDFGKLVPPRSPDLAHLVLIDNPTHHPAGDFALENGRVSLEGAQKYTFSGIGVYDPALFAEVAAGTKCQLATVLKPNIAAGRVSGEHYSGRWCDVGTPERLKALDRALRS